MTTTHKTISVTTYTVVFAVLMLLLVLTVAVAFFHFGDFNIIIALAIASLKALLIAVYFMHLRFALPLTRVVAVGAVLWLGIAGVLTMADYLTRGWHEPLEYTNPIGTMPSGVDRSEFNPEPGEPAQQPERLRREQVED